MSISLPEKTSHAIKTSLQYVSFCEIDSFPLGVFSILYIDLHMLKGNGNTACVDKIQISDKVFGNV